MIVHWTSRDVRLGRPVCGQAGIIVQLDWIEGDILGLAMPTHPEALRAAGPDFLTAAFRRFGALSADNAVTRITRFEICARGTKGRKAFMDVEYARPDLGLHTELFVKFSRAFDEPLRDNQRFEMESEARFAAASATPDFPIPVPACYFSDFHHASGTGMIVTQCIPFGRDGNEPQYEKCHDWQVPDILDHYRVMFTTNGRLAASHRAGELPPVIYEYFPFDRAAAVTAERIRYDAQRLRNRVSRYGEFCRNYPQVLPSHIREPDFVEALMHDVPRFLEHELAIRTWLYSRPSSIVFAHWNCHLDNVWFWRGDDGRRRCGFIDWGHAGQMHVAQAMWGTLSGAELEIWDDHLDELIGLFAAPFASLPEADRLDPERVRLETYMHVGLAGTSWLLDAVPLVLSEVPDLGLAESRKDPLVVGNERARSQLHMMTVFMHLLRSHGLAERLDCVLEQIRGTN